MLQRKCDPGQTEFSSQIRQLKSIQEKVNMPSYVPQVYVRIKTKILQMALQEML